MRTVTIIAALSVVAVVTPAFSDQLFDNCFKLATEQIGPVGQTAHGHFQKFVRECARGKIPGVTGVSVAVSPTIAETLAVKKDLLSASPDQPAIDIAIDVSLCAPPGAHFFFRIARLQLSPAHSRGLQP